MAGDLTRREKRDTERRTPCDDTESPPQREGTMWRRRQSLVRCCSKPRKAKECWQPSAASKRQGRILP